MRRRDILSSIAAAGLNQFANTLTPKETQLPQKALKLTDVEYDGQLKSANGARFLSDRAHHEIGRISTIDCVVWLQTFGDQTVDFIFADPPYNIGKAAWDSFESHDSYVEWCLTWTKECSRVLKPSGSLMVCGFTEIIADISGPARKHFDGLKWLIWHYKNKANLGKDFGRSHESIVHFRKKDFRLNVDSVRIPYGQHTLKYPNHPQAASSDFAQAGKKHIWEPNPLGAKPKDVIEVPTTSNGMSEKTPHPTQKPEELLRKLILAASLGDQLVIDPFSGSGTTAVAAEQLDRRWSACDLEGSYNRWAVDRLSKVSHRGEDYWLEVDSRVARRRESIR